MRALFLSTNTELAAGVRYRLLQYFPHLYREGIQPEHRTLFDGHLDRIAYRSGHTGAKLVHFSSGTIARVIDALRAGRYDVVFLLREAFLVGPPFLEALLRARRVPFILDVDDAIWTAYDSPTYGKVARWLKCSWKTPMTMRMANLVTAGNSYVAEYAAKQGATVELLPTVVDTAAYTPKLKNDSGEPVLGWIGSHSTFQYLRPLLHVLERLAREHRFRLRIVGAEAEIPPQSFPIENVPWELEREIEEVRSFDIGLFPVVEDAWSRGKSGFKAVQYGAVGIPTVASPVTTNREIVLDGKTGLYANGEDQWFESLRRLLLDPALRDHLGSRARKRICDHYSLDVHAPRFVNALRRAVAENR
jgi:glycosyltransferase involved in cell wall biosynthesis